jgi:transcriptional regulator with AAA-type ATPase domain
MKILLSFTGFHDPFASNSADAPTGPILTILSEEPFDSVFILATPRMQEISEATEAEILERGLCRDVTILPVEAPDPTDYGVILSSLRTHFKSILKTHPRADFSIGISSGTPQIHACWLMLVASGEIPARLLQTTPPQFVEHGKSLVREVDIGGDVFPRMTLPLRGKNVHFSVDEDVITAVRAQVRLVGEDPAFLAALKEAAVYAQYDDIHLLFLGETGTGKERFTEFIHLLSPRSIKPLVTVNCSSIPRELVESHLFGHKKGAFTGASSDQIGKFKAADGGIIFLDELGELPLEAQAKLLRVLENGEIEPVGHPKFLKVNVRVIAATNRNLREMVAQGTFREDLYQRFGASVEIPALRERRSDVPLLASYLLEEWNRKHRRGHSLSPKAFSSLVKNPWSGNIRELRKVITQSAMLCDHATIDEADLRFELPFNNHSESMIPEPDEAFELSHYLEDIKRRIVERALAKENGVQAKAAKLLGWTPQGLGQYLKSQKK